MKNFSRKKLLVLFEIGGDYMVSELIVSVKKQYPQIRTYIFHGLFKNYNPGGLNLKRLINLFYMFFLLPFVVLYLRPNDIFVRTSPPGLQWWAVLCGKAINCKVGCWLMDYHPEIEARILDKIPCLNYLSVVLRYVDSYVMRKLDFIVAIDHAMKRLLKRRFGIVPIIFHPTWTQHSISKCSPKYLTKTVMSSNKEVRIIYAGNLGSLHPLETFEKLIYVLKNEKKVQIYTVGLSQKGLKRINKITSKLKVKAFHVKKFKDFNELGAFIYHNSINLGLITLQNWAAGLISPSKYNGYISFGTPILYIGPSGTNSYDICSKYKAGLALSNNASAKSISKAAKTLANQKWIHTASKNTATAREYFDSNNADSLTHILCHYFKWELVDEKI